MSPETEGILIGSGAIVFAGLLTYVATQLARLWRTPKRLDRLERIIPTMARGLWALLGEHVREHNGDTSAEIVDAYRQLTDVVTDGVVSQKAQP